MDLGAHVQIEDLSSIAAENGIEIPRLRGLRLMSEESAVSEAEIAEMVRQHELFLCERGCRTVPRFHPDSSMTELSPRTRRIKEKYCVREMRTGVRPDGSGYSYETTIGFRWDLLHGKRRKVMRFAIKKGRRAVIRQFEMFNKYAGRDDVLYIHARIGGGNWIPYGGEYIEKQPWFLEKVDDYFDDTYCDIYARIDKRRAKDADVERVRT